VTSAASYAVCAVETDYEADVAAAFAWFERLVAYEKS
jgi:hypothetical protein